MRNMSKGRGTFPIRSEIDQSTMDIFYCEKEYCEDLMFEVECIDVKISLFALTIYLQD